MIVKINRQDFLKGINTVEKTIIENKVKPILSNAFMEARAGELFFCGTNLETTITTVIPCDDVIAEGKIVFQYQMVEEYVNELKDEKITLSITEENNLLIESEDSSSEFTLMDPEDYPKIPVDFDFDQKTENFAATGKDIADIFEKVKFGAYSSSDNLALSCVKIESKDNILKLVTTDKYRLVYLENELEKINSPINVSIPLNAVESLVKLFRSNESSNVKFYTIDGKVIFRLGNTLTISRIVDLPFPDYALQLEKNKYDKKLTIQNGEFSKILKRIIIFVKDNNEAKYGACFKLNGSEMTIDGANDLAKINEILNVNYVGEEIKISLNAKFLLDFVQNLNKEDNVIIDLMSSKTSVRVTSTLDSQQTIKDAPVPAAEGTSADAEQEVSDKAVLEQGKENIATTIKEKKYVYIVMPLALKE